MPNWCYNNLSVIGEGPEVNNFIDDNCGADEGANPQPLLFSKSVPEPELEDDGWYNWRLDNWGTKWEPNFEGGCQIDVREIDTGGRSLKMATYSFDTAWGPGDRWLEKTATKYPNLTFCLVYSEGGMNFGGSVIYKNGELRDESQGEYADYVETDGFYW